MLYLLQPEDYSQVRNLFQPLMFQPFCAAALEGISPSQIFVDDPTTPHTAWLITRGMWSYLAGEPHNEAFNRALNRSLFAKEIVGEDVFGLLISCPPNEWDAGLVTVCQPRQPIPEPRRHYVCHSLSYDWRANVPDGYVIQPVDKTLMGSVQGDIPDDVQGLLERNDPAADPLRKGFGFVAIHEGQLAAYAVIDCVVGQMGEIGLFTEEAHRKRGLATITSAAAIEYGLIHGLAEIIWDCAEHNTGSIRTAEKLALDYERSHVMHIVMFDEVTHSVSLAWAYLDARRYLEVIDVCEQVMAQQESVSPTIHYLAACASSGLNMRENAFHHLNMAAERGWNSLEFIETRREFEDLRQMPEWEGVLERVRDNA